MKPRLLAVTFITLLILMNGNLVAGNSPRKNTDLLSSRALAQQANELIIKARATGEGELYDQAKSLFKQAVQLDAKNTAGLTGLGIVSLNSHQFLTAKIYAEKSLAINDFQPGAYGVLVDALIELGQYSQALAAAERMIAIRPDNAALTRVSYLRELHGDLAGAVAALEKAWQFGFDTREGASWCQMQTGKLYLLQGKLIEAERCFRQAIELHSVSGQAMAGLAKVLGLKSKNKEAIYFALQAAEVQPIGENFVTLAEQLRDNGLEALATEQIEKTLQLLRHEKEDGMDVDDELAALLSDWHIDHREALTLAESVYSRRPTVNNAHLLAKIHLSLGNLKQAAHYAGESLKLNTSYPHFYYISGKIEYQLGTNIGLAAEHLTKALSINPYFSRSNYRDVKEMLAAIESK